MSKTITMEDVLLDADGLPREHEATIKNLRLNTEEGSVFLTCMKCGACWAVVECESETGHEYLDFEEVAEGDGYCLDNYGRQS